MSTDRRHFLKEAGMVAVAAATADVVTSTKAEASVLVPAEVERQVRVEGIESQIERVASAKMRKRLGLPPDTALPKDIAAMIHTHASSAASGTVKLGATADAQAAARDIGRRVTVEDFQEKLAAARTGLQAIGSSQDVDQILKERANMLWKKRQALEAAGFPGADAMQIVLADIAARGQ